MPKKIMNTKKATHDEWLAARRLGIGGSDCACLVNMNPYSGPLTLYSRKLGLVKEVEDNEAMRLGRDIEQYVADRFMEATGKKVINDNHMYQSDVYPFMLADIDRKVVGENAGFEAKTMGSFSGYNIEAGEIPSHYYCQCQHYCAVMGFSRMYIGILVLQKGFYWHTIERDDDFIAALIKAEGDFWNNNIIPKKMPMPEGEPDLEALKEIYPEGRKDSEIAIYGLDALIRDYRAFSELEKEYKAKAEKVKAIVCSKLGDYEIGTGDVYGCSWKSQNKTSIDTSRLKAEMPEVYKKYSTVSKYRVFRTKEMKKKEK